MTSRKNGPWAMAFRNLSRNKRRNAATGVAIGLGFAALLALGGYINRVDNNLRVHTIYAFRTGHLTIYKKDGLAWYSVKPKLYSLTADDLKKIEDVVHADPNVELSGPELSGTGLIGNGCRTVPFLATGIEPALDLKLRRHPEMERWTDHKDSYTHGKSLDRYPLELGGVVLADGLARLLHKQKVHDDFPPDQKPVMVTDCLAPEAKEQLAADANVQLAAGSWSGMLSALDGEVVATYSPGTTETMNAAIVTSIEHLRKLYDTENASTYSIWFKDARHIEALRADFEKAFAAAGVDVDVYQWNDEKIAPMYTGTMQFLVTMVSFISFVLATVIVFSVFNAATMTVIERSQEIGMMRSLGYTRGEIRRLFVREMVALSTIAVVLGGIVGAAGIASVNAAGIWLNPPGVAGGIQLKLLPNGTIVVGAAVLIYALAILTTLTAVRTVAKRNIAVLLMGSHR